MPLLKPAVSLFLPACVLLANGAAGAVKETESAITLFAGERPVFVYNKSKLHPPEGIDDIYARSGHLHPVYSPAGEVVTDAFPPDHAHQSGIFFAWTKAFFRGQRVDFWNLGKGMGHVAHRKVLSIEEDPEHPGFKVELVHVDTTAEKPVDVLSEVWEIRLVHANERAFIFDLGSEQRCLTDDPLELKEHLYGGMAIRANRQWFGPTAGTDAPKVLTSAGLDRISGDQQEARWIMMSGKIDEKATAIVCLSHPDNFRHPQPVRIHDTMPYFCWSPGNREGFSIEPGEVYASKYRWIICSQIPDPEWIAAQYELYSNPKTPEEPVGSGVQ